MKSLNISLQDVNKNYSSKKPISLKIIDVIFVLYILVCVVYLIFCVIFIKAEVIGVSMQPTFNKNLSLDEDYEKSIYKDIVFANRFKEGTNGDIVLVQTQSELVIKRIIAKENQKLTLQLEDGYYYFYLTEENSTQAKKINEYYIGNNRSAMAVDYEYPDFQNYYERFRDANRDLIIDEGYPNRTTILIPKGKIFILGDNRGYSNDSSSYGVIDKEKIQGTVSFSYEYNQNFFSFLWQEICSIF